MMKLSPQMTRLIGAAYAAHVANSILSVQPMDEAGKALTRLDEMLKGGKVLVIRCRNDANNISSSNTRSV